MTTTPLPMKLGDNENAPTAASPPSEELSNGGVGCRPRKSLEFRGRVFVAVCSLAIAACIVLPYTRSGPCPGGKPYSAPENKWCAPEKQGYHEIDVFPHGPVVLPPLKDENSWDDKYVVEYHWVDAIRCDASFDRDKEGTYTVGDEEYAEWEAAAEDSAVRKTCKPVRDANHQYKYCDPDAKTRSACVGTSVNATFFETLGYPGQDCWSWERITDMLEF